ncbi:hypothetical protein O3M35_010501 [Rhynocoris fuscipes]|uniref:Uncharacterized protein n=1 Tax=Rhynocoris fuscipes TaxID=488301 RepID=A0AAW1D6V0_9HEMI
MPFNYPFCSTNGMFVFLKGIVLSVLPCKCLLQLSDSEKGIIHEEVQNGIDSNVVKPLQYSIIPNTTLNIDATHMIKNINTEDNMKLVTKCERSEALSTDKDIFICSDQKNYVIINYEDAFYVDLIRWLLSRGAKNIYMLAENYLIPSISQRFICVKNNHPTARIHLQPNTIIDDKNKLKKYFNDLGGEIAEIFIVGEVLENDVSNIESVIKEVNTKCSLVCIGNGGEPACELRHKDGFPAIAISCSSNLMKPSLIFPEIDRFINNRINNAVIFLEEDINEDIQLGPNAVSISHDKYPKNIEELLELSKRIVPKACFVEVLTSSPNYRYNRALKPIFLLPGLKPNDMQRLASKMYYPTFEARLPQTIDDIDSIANELYQDLKRFEFNVFTLIANDWGGALGLSLAKKLEDNGKVVLLVMLNSSPNVVLNWVTDVLEMGEINLINKYVKIPYKVKKKLYLLSEWNEKLTVTMENCVPEENDRERIKNGLNYLRKCLLAFKDYSPDSKKYQGKCFIYLPNEEILEDYGTITQYCKRKPLIEVIPSNSHQDMLDDPQLVTKINALIPYEYQTAAQEINCEIFGDYIQLGRRMLSVCQ